MIIAIQGSMAVGKTTLVGYLQQALPEAIVSYEDVAPVVAEMRARQLDKNKFEDYLEIQKLWIKHEIQRYHKVKDLPLVLMDFGAEEIDFYTFNYPQALGEDWDVSAALQAEIAELRQCLPDHVLFLEAKPETLRQRKAANKTRSRNFFDFQLEKLLPLKRQWFAGKDNVSFLQTDGLSAEEVGKKALLLLKQWLENEMP
ncbi:AAA family ATPase [Streptococcus dentiloxodontae]